MSQYCQPMYNMVCHLNGFPIRQLNMVPYNYFYQQPIRLYPGVDTSLLEQSAKSMQNLMKEASLVLNKLAESKPFANKIMYAAQHSNMKEVEMLIQSTGIKSKVKTSFNPDGINFKLSSKVGSSDCCHLTIALRWL
ncbi:MAG: hypothetical protein ACQEWV_11085 [Bacillota bacterium]